MPACAVKWCKSHSDISKDSGVSFHIFPKDPVRRDLWKKAVQFERQENDWIPSKKTLICSIHFKDEDLYLSKKGFTQLNKTAIPICTMVFSSEKSPPTHPNTQHQPKQDQINMTKQLNPLNLNNLTSLYLAVMGVMYALLWITKQVNETLQDVPKNKTFIFEPSPYD